MTSRTVLACLALAAFALAVPQAAALPKKSKKEELAIAKKKVRAKYGEKKGGAVFHDCSHWVDMKKLDDSRWDVPQKHAAYKSDLSGVVLIANFSLNNSAGTGTAIKVVCQKWQQTDTGSKYSMPFDHIGESYSLSQVKKCHDGFYRDWIAQAKDVLTKKCIKPKKQKTGPAEYFASATGTDPETNTRVRKDWYMWGKSNETFMISVEYAANILNSDGMIDKGVAFVKAVKRVKDKVPIIYK